MPRPNAFPTAARRARWLRRYSSARCRRSLVPSSGRFEPRRSLCDLPEDVLDALEYFGEPSLFGQRRDAKMVAVRRVEARSRRDQHVLLLEQLHRERFVVEPRQFLLVDADERVHRAARCDETQEIAVRNAVDDRFTRLIQPAARRT